MTRPARRRDDRLVLAIETTAPRSGVALVDAGGPEPRVISESHVAGRAPAETLAGCVRDVLACGGAQAADLFGLAVVDGPGSYTGLRAGLALARGIAFADALPAAAIGSLELIAAAAPREVRRACALLDASNRKVYAACYERDGERLVESHAPVVVSVDEWPAAARAWGGDWTMCGDGALDATIALDVIVPDARAAVLGRLGARMLLAGGGRGADAVLPRYVGAVGARPQSTTATARALVR